MVKNMSEVELVERGQWLKSYKKKKTMKRAMIVLLLILVGTACYLSCREGTITPASNDPAVEGAMDTGKMKKFKSYDELRAFMEAKESADSGATYEKTMQRTATFANSVSLEADSSSGWGSADAVPSAAPTAAVDEAATDASDYSTTNVQEAGVDEDDIIKTDGNYVYAVDGQSVVIVKAAPADQTAIVSSIKLEYYPAGIYINGDKLTIFGNGYDISTLKERDKVDAGRFGSYADFRIYDVSDRTKPSLEKQYDFEGSFQNSRMIGDYVYFVTGTRPVYAYYKTRAIPYMMVDGAVASDAVMPSVYYFDYPYTSQNMTSISAINVKDSSQAPTTEVYVLDGNQDSMYVSDKNIYITLNQYVSEQQLTVGVIRGYMLGLLGGEDRQKINEIESVKDYILSDEEKSYKVMEIFMNFIYSADEDRQKQIGEELAAEVKARSKEIAGEMRKTIIHKIAIDGANLNYKTMGSVPGQVLNQYAMDESGAGNFRIATTVSAFWTSFSSEQIPAYNNLFVLDGDLKRIGAVEDIATGETIRSVRFMSDRAYLVTFLRTDPLFVIGLSDETKPAILGELKVPGYSTYLHPYGDNMIIGLGKNADEEGRETDGIKLSLFDAADVANPKEIDTYILGEYGSDSSALYDAKAFLFSKEKNLLVIPATVRKASNRYESKVTASGAAVFKIAENGFEMRGIVDHRVYSKINDYYSAEAKRSLYIGNDLFSLSDNFLKVTRLDDLVTSKTVELSGEPDAVPYPVDYVSTRKGLEVSTMPAPALDE